MNNRLWSWRTLLLILVLMPGCSGEHEEEHLEHYVPPHKPADLIKAVSELERRIPLVCGSETPPSATDQQELVDIILWIPELAADSDLRKADWEKAAAVSAAMHQTLVPSPTASVTQGDRQKAQEQLSPLVADLKTLLLRVSVEPHRQPSEPTEPDRPTEPAGSTESKEQEQ